jgi:tetratricopeptide (TPR) repeat protein
MGTGSSNLLRYDSRPLTVIAVIVLGALVGCTEVDRRPIKASAEALDQQDFDQAMLLANEAIEDNPNGPNAAEALYLRGRAYEQHPVTSQAQLQANMQAARLSYVEALKHNPSAKLTTYIQTSLGKVALYQDDFTTAIQQLTAAYASIGDPSLQPAVLYHLAKAQQRAGQFAQADVNFLAVMQRYPTSAWATKAKETRGSRSFYVQLAVYQNPAQADAATKTLRSRGIEPKRFLDSQNRQLLRSGPYASYEDAKKMRQKTLDLYPDAVIVP